MARVRNLPRKRLKLTEEEKAERAANKPKAMEKAGKRKNYKLNNKKTKVKKQSNLKEKQEIERRNKQNKKLESNRKITSKIKQGTPKQQAAQMEKARKSREMLRKVNPTELQKQKDKQQKITDRKNQAKENFRKREEARKNIKPDAVVDRTKKNKLKIKDLLGKTATILGFAYEANVGDARPTIYKKGKIIPNTFYGRKNELKGKGVPALDMDDSEYVKDDQKDFNIKLAKTKQNNKSDMSKYKKKDGILIQNTYYKKPKSSNNKLENKKEVNEEVKKEDINLIRKKRKDGKSLVKVKSY